MISKVVVNKFLMCICAGTITATAPKVYHRVNTATHNTATHKTATHKATARKPVAPAPAPVPPCIPIPEHSISSDNIALPPEKITILDLPNLDSQNRDDRGFSGGRYGGFGFGDDLHIDRIIRYPVIPPIIPPVYPPPVEPPVKPPVEPPVTPPPGVPEPAVWLNLMLGFGIVGFILRQRNLKIV
jgi:hypothetical protein